MTLQFPVDISNDTKYEARVRFIAREIEAVDVAQLFGKLTSILPDNATEEEIQQDVAGRLQDDPNLKSLNGNDPAIQSTKKPGKTPAELIRGSCILYLPQAVQIADRAEYDNVDLGIIGAGVEAGMNAGQGAVNAFADQALKNVDSVVKAITGGTATGTPAGRLAVNRAARLIPNEQARGAVRASTRTVVNPNTRALFKSIPLREFTFNFKMIPTSVQETQMIKDIILFFRKELYPQLIEIDGLAAGFEYPNVFDITMYYKDPSKGLATKLQPCYLRNFSATYNAGSMAFLEGGDFAEVDISMSFIESQALDKKKILEGF